MKQNCQNVKSTKFSFHNFSETKALEVVRKITQVNGFQARPGAIQLSMLADNNKTVLSVLSTAHNQRGKIRESGWD